jgi:hypothetical protein
MNNLSIFNQFDMVVSVTEQTINDQLTHLVTEGVVHPKLILAQVLDPKTGNYNYKVLDDEKNIPANSAFLNADILPQVSIDQSGLSITFIIKMIGGTAGFWVGNGPAAKLKTYTIGAGGKEWAYAINVDMDLYQLQKGDIGKKIKVPKLIEDQLKHFTEDMFSVNSLLMDFESVNLIKFNPTKTSAGDAGDIGIVQMVEFMQFYIKYLIASGNPFILGYAIQQNNIPPSTAKIPSSLQPTGTAYTMFQDAQNGNLSNLNYALVTKGGFTNISGSPSTFDTNWFAANDTNINAKMIVRSNDLIEKLILEPFYNNIQANVFKQIQGKISTGEGSSYATAKTAASNGYSFVINNQPSGNDQYVNTFDVAFNNSAGKTEIDLNGRIHIRKDVFKDCGVCTAHAWASGDITWNGTITISAEKDANGVPQLKVGQTSKILTHTTNHDTNTCADVMKVLGDILGGILDIFSLGLDGGFFTKLFENLMTVNIPGIGSLEIAFANIGQSLTSNVLMPAGQTFFFKDPSIDPQGNFYLDLTYKTSH